jgi:hypothetical protein
MKLLRYILIILILLILSFLVKEFVLPIVKSSNALLKVTTPNLVADVVLDDKDMGKTPYLGERLRVGDHRLTLKGKLASPSAKEVEFSSVVSLSPQTLTAINYDFGPSKIFSSGDIRSLRDGEGISVVSTPSDSEITLDGERIGQSPVTQSANSGVHKIRVSKEGYYTRELEVNLEEGSTLILEVFLAKMPFGSPKKIADGRVALYNLSSDDSDLSANTKTWSEAVFFFESASNLDFDALIDERGELYLENKDEWVKKMKDKKEINLGYLGTSEDASLTKEATATFNQVKRDFPASASTTKRVRILSTPTGTLNVRSGPGQNFSILEKVRPGQTFTLLAEQSSWYKIRTSTGQGWISSQYARKL